ncbi:unnamed protein product [Prorocentrum cordatum]|uniref:Prolyl aminopeptidase n=1 Tax=Prorocentrum cordatum TaxID=2364126 RepID=A0ABN9TVN5_9DINO|nr:unnamed protein product [Polarella glacialis]
MGGGGGEERAKGDGDGVGDEDGGQGRRGGKRRRRGRRGRGPRARTRAARSRKSAEGCAAAGGTPGFRALHVVGARDDVNPPQGGLQVAAALGGDVLEHPGRHECPMDGQSLAAYRRFLAEAVGPSA